eukprot:Stramenopile-MAST_4_protein_628
MFRIFSSKKDPEIVCLNARDYERWPNTTVKTVQHFVKKDPDVLGRIDQASGEYLPITWAVICKARKGVVNFILNKMEHEHGIKVDIRRLHDECAWRWIRTSEKTIERLSMMEGERSFCTPNEYGEIPLTLAVKYGAPLPVIRCIHEKYAEGIKWQDKAWGYTLLHKAVGNRNKIPIPYLLLRFPEAAQKKDKNGYTPVDIAIEEGYKDIIYLLPRVSREKTL